jgi:uncharacterized protein (DUF2235 family)
MFFFDGTSNRAAGPTDIIETNVFTLNRAFTYGFSGVPQIAFYFSGVGTRRDIFSAATGRGFDEIIIEAFINLASNYMNGDRIYLFGFSRGAAAARALSGLLSNPGLLSADNLNSFSELWKYFLGVRLGEAERDRLRTKLRDRLFYPKPTIRFLGAFDTVAGSSWDRLNLFTKVRFHSLHLDKSVNAAVQILAIDDNRNPSFSPLLWDKKSRPDQILEQIWLPGVHSDIGGSSDGRFLGNVALLTMIDRIKKYCPELEWDDDYVNEVLESLAETTRIEITSERSGILRKFLSKNSRLMGHHPGEYIHSVYQALHGRDFLVKGSRQTYQSAAYNGALPILTTRHDAAFREACKAALDTQL